MKHKVRFIVHRGTQKGTHFLSTLTNPIGMRNFRRKSVFPRSNAVFHRILKRPYYNVLYINTRSSPVIRTKENPIKPGFFSIIGIKSTQLGTHFTNYSHQTPPLHTASFCRRVVQCSTFCQTADGTCRAHRILRILRTNRSLLLQRFSV